MFALLQGTLTCESAAQPDAESLNNPLYLSSHVWKDMESRTPVGCSHFFAWHLELCCDFMAYSQPEPSEHSSAQAAGCCLASRRNYINLKAGAVSVRSEVSQDCWKFIRSRCECLDSGSWTCVCHKGYGSFLPHPILPLLQAWSRVAVTEYSALILEFIQCCYLEGEISFGLILIKTTRGLG